MRYSDQMRHVLKFTDDIKIKEFVGLLLYSAIFKWNRDDADCLPQMVQEERDIVVLCQK